MSLDKLRIHNLGDSYRKCTPKHEWITALGSVYQNKNGTRSLRDEEPGGSKEGEIMFQEK